MEEDNFFSFLTDDEIPDIFDPFEESKTDYSKIQLNDDNTCVVDEAGNPVPLSPQQEQFLISNMENSAVALMQIGNELEEQQAHPDDPSKIFPPQIFQMLDNGFVYFNDSAFVAPTIRSLQNKKTTSQCKGYILCPVQASTRIRSSKAAHSKPVPVLFCPAEGIPQLDAPFRALISDNASPL